MITSDIHWEGGAEGFMPIANPTSFIARGTYGAD